MLMRKETEATVTTIKFCDFYTPVRIEQLNKRSGYLRIQQKLITAFAQSPTGYKHQLELLGYVRIKETGGAFNGICGTTE